MKDLRHFMNRAVMLSENLIIKATRDASEDAIGTILKHKQFYTRPFVDLITDIHVDPDGNIHADSSRMYVVPVEPDQDGSMRQNDMLATGYEFSVRSGVIPILVTFAVCSTMYNQNNPAKTASEAFTNPDSIGRNTLVVISRTLMNQEYVQVYELDRYNKSVTLIQDESSKTVAEKDVEISDPLAILYAGSYCGFLWAHRKEKETAHSASEAISGAFISLKDLNVK